MTLLAQETQPLDLGWTQGDAVSFSLRFKAQDALAGHTWSAQVRRARSRTSGLVLAFDASATADAGDCVVALAVQAADNTLAGQFYWDLQSDGGAGAVRTWVGGRVGVGPDVTTAEP